MSDERTFRYHDGAAEVHGDPAALRRDLFLATAGRLNALLRDYYAGNAARRRGATGDDLTAAELLSCEAAAVLLPSVRNVFGLKPLDPATGQGATDDDADAVLCAFLNYLTSVKKKTRDLALDCAAYGAGFLGRAIAPEERLGLTLNRRLALGFIAAAVKKGQEAADGRRADPALFDALFESEDEAREAEWLHNSAALMARAGGR